MTRFEAGDIVRVPFPHVETNQRRYRPALVLTREPIGLEGLLIWLAMITNAKRKPWPGDVEILGHAAAGLPIPSVVRTAKIATLEAASADRIGRLRHDQIGAVQDELRVHLGLS